MKKILSILLAAALMLSMLAGCGGSGANNSQAPNNPPAGNSDTPNNPDNPNPPASDVTIQVAAIETAYEEAYPGMWQEVCDAFTAATGIRVELIKERELEDVIGPSMQGGDFPDVIHLATGRPAGLTEQFINERLIAEITDVLDMTIPGESATVGSKIIDGFTSANNTRPYGDGLYLAPMFYSPCGLFYNASLFKSADKTAEENEGLYDLPTTWDEMWALADQAKADGRYLFTYPTAGYFDAFLYGLTWAIGGEEFFNDVTNYKEGVWDTPQADKLFEILDKLADNTHPNTPAQANNQDFTRNQLMVMTNDALFMPNGTWIVGEMSGAMSSAAEGFQWGEMVIPGVNAGDKGASVSFIEQAWIPAGAEHIPEAKQFIAFLYSDVAAEIFAKGGAAQPINGIVDSMTGDNQIFYGIYDNGASAVLGGFAAYQQIPGIDNTSVFFAPINSLVSGSLTIEQWKADIISATDQMRDNLL